MSVILYVHSLKTTPRKARDIEIASSSSPKDTSPGLTMRIKYTIRNRGNPGIEIWDSFSSVENYTPPPRREMSYSSPWRIKQHKPSKEKGPIVTRDEYKNTHPGIRGNHQNWFTIMPWCCFSTPVTNKRVVKWFFSKPSGKQLPPQVDKSGCFPTQRAVIV